MAGNAVGTTRDEEFARQIINIILCKIYDEKYTRQEDIVSFRAGIEEEPAVIAERIRKRFDEAKLTYKDVIDNRDVIDLDDKTLTYIVGELQSYSLMSAKERRCRRCF